MLMFARMEVRRPSSLLAYQQLQGHCVTQGSAPTSDIWWQDSDLPSYVLNSAAGTDPGNGSFSMTGLAKEAALLHIRARVIVHFFSGYRRTGDLHEVIEQRTLMDNSTIFVISVDLCMQRHHADLATDQALIWWQKRALEGHILAVGGGPPCETYTAARYHLIDGEHAPRPLRSADELAGLPALTRRERSQLWIGDSLIRFLIRMLITMAKIGLAGFMEHPQYPTWFAARKPASLWSWRAVKLLKGLECCSIVSFDQCVVGADACKPTTLLLIRLPHLRKALLQRGSHGRCNHPKGTHTGLIGRQSDGSYQTSRAKVYPPAMNALIGHAMLEFADQFAEVDTEDALPPEFELFFCNQEYADASKIQRDYHG